MSDKSIYGYTTDTGVTAVELNGRRVHEQAPPAIVTDDEIRFDTPAAQTSLFKQGVPSMGNKTRARVLPRLVGVRAKRPSPITASSLTVTGTLTYPPIEGTTIRLDGLTAIMTYSDSSTKDVTDSIILTSEATTWGEPGASQEITIGCPEGLRVITTTATYTVLADTPASLALTGDWEDTAYTGAAVSAAGITATATFLSGATEDVTEDVTVAPAIWPVTAGEHTITFSYTAKGVTVTATKAATVVLDVPASLALTGELTASQVAGTVPDLTGLVATATYLSGKTEVVTESVTASPATYPAEAGEVELTVSYTESEITVSATMTVTTVSSGE